MTRLNLRRHSSIDCGVLSTINQKENKVVSTQGLLEILVVLGLFNVRILKPWLMRIRFAQISLTQLFKKNPSRIPSLIHTYLLSTLRDLRVK